LEPVNPSIIQAIKFIPNIRIEFKHRNSGNGSEWIILPSTMLILYNANNKIIIEQYDKQNDIDDG
jgi:hypothetical protein